MPQTIYSVTNSRIKALYQLREKSRNRKKEGRFLVEGRKEIEMALLGHYEISTLLYTPEILTPKDLEKLGQKLDQATELIEISLEIYQKLAYRKTTEGVLAVTKSKNTSLETLTLTSDHPLLLVAEAPEKPGNLGALLRTADAAGVDALLVANPKTDIYNPNTIRSSMGCLFTTPIATATSAEIISFLKQYGIKSYAASLQAAVDYTAMDYTQATALVVGNEAVGLSQAWRDQSTQNIIIPMHGHIDSMNVSVAAGILIFEAKRQRKP